MDPALRFDRQCSQTATASYEFEIRPFNADDADSVLKIRNDNLNRFDSRDYPKHIIETMISTFTRETLLQISQDPSRIFLVAVSKSKVVGVGGLYNDDVRLMCVDHLFQGKGIGKELLKRIENIARQNGVAKLNVSSSLPAEGFYQKNGFVKYGEMKEDRWGPCILMSKQLSGGTLSLPGCSPNVATPGPGT